MSKILTAFTLLGLTLTILFIDIGGKFSPWIYEYYENGWQTIKGTIQATNPYQMLEQIIELIKKLQINYLVLEREATEQVPDRKDFKDYIWITHSLLIHCQLYQIKGCSILPLTQLETRKWRERKNYCWRKRYTQNEYWCDAHQKLEPNKIPTLDEVDVECQKEIFYQKLIPGPELLKERESIFNSPMKIKEVADYQKTYTERTNYYRIKQNVQNPSH